MNALSLTRGLTDFARWLGQFLIGLGALWALLWLTDRTGHGERAFFALGALACWAAGGILWLLSATARRLQGWWRARRAA